MPGYLIHLASTKAEALNNRSFVLGVEAPDLLKKHLKVCGGIEGARAKYEKLRTSDMPEYSELEARVQQKEKLNSTEGLHYGFSSSPDIKACWNSFSDEQKKNPFYRGYIWHLLTDAIIYGRLNFENKFQKVLEENQGRQNIEELQKIEVKKLHSDWDKTNSRVHNTYPEVSLPEEIQELNVVQFSEGDTVYVDWPLLKGTIDYLRTFDPLNDNMEDIIDNIIDNI